MTMRKLTLVEIQQLVLMWAQTAGRIKADSCVAVTYWEASTDTDMLHLRLVDDTKSVWAGSVHSGLMTQPMADIKDHFITAWPSVFRGVADPVKNRIDKLREEFVAAEKSIITQLDALHEQLNKLTLEYNVRG